MTTANTKQLLDSRLEAYLTKREEALSTDVDILARIISTPGNDTPENLRHRLDLLCRLVELQTLRQTMEQEEQARRQNELDSFEAEINETPAPTARENITTHYDVTADGRICNPGKFESEPLYAVHFWNWIMEGEGEDMQDDDGTTWTVLDVTAEDRADFPEIYASIYRVALREDCQGFIHMIDNSTPRFNELGTAEDRAEQAEQAEDTPSLDLENTIMDPRL